MSTMRVLGIGLFAVLTLGAMGASAASAKTVLELKDEGVPVALGAALGVQLETAYGECKLTQQARMSVNGAKKDEIVVARAASEKVCFVNLAAGHDGSIFGGVKEITLAPSGGVIFRGPPLGLTFGNTDGPFLICTWDFRKFVGRSPVSGHAVIEGSMRGKINKQESHGEGTERGCRRHPFLTTGFVITVTGHNGKPLETEVIG